MHANTWQLTYIRNYARDTYVEMVRSIGKYQLKFMVSVSGSVFFNRYLTSVASSLKKKKKTET